MNIVKSRYNKGYYFSMDKEGKSSDADAFYYQAIENAGGVPYELIFGQNHGEGIYLNTGDGITRLLGIKSVDFPEELFNTMIEEIITPDRHIPTDLSEARRKFISGEIRSYRAELLIRTAEGVRKWIRDSSLPIINEDTGKVIGAFGIFCDITDSRLNPGKMNKLRKDEDDCDSLKAAFLHNISHEIRTPLNAIVGFCTLLNEPPDSSNNRKAYLDIITLNADHLLGIIDDIVEMSKVEAGTIRINKTMVTLGPIVRRVYNEFAADAKKKGITLSFSVPDGDIETEMFTDSYRLTQVIQNLVNNAIKFTDKGSVRFGYSVKEKKIEFYVSDTGIGIPDEHQANVFRRFYQVDSSSSRSYGGTGLGLAISKAYVELLGGEIWFTSQSGGGSEFRFTLPD